MSPLWTPLRCQDSKHLGYNTADLSARGHPKYPLFSWTPRLWAHSRCWLVAGMHHGPPPLQGPCWVAREGRMQSSIRIQRCHCRKPLPFPGTHGFRKLDTDGTHPLTWPREEESGNSPSGSHWLEPGHVVCAVFPLRGAGILDHPRASLSICLTRPLSHTLAKPIYRLLPGGPSLNTPLIMPYSCLAFSYLVPIAFRI